MLEKQLHALKLFCHNLIEINNEFQLITETPNKITIKQLNHVVFFSRNILFRNNFNTIDN